MENENNRDYNQEDRNSQDQSKNFNQQGNSNADDSIQLGSSDNRNVGNDENTNDSNYNPSDRTNTVAGTGSESFTETERYSAQNSDFDSREGSDQNEDFIPDSEDIDDEGDEFEDDTENQNRTPGL